MYRYPRLVRPFVLGGLAMEIVRNQKNLEYYATVQSKASLIIIPLLVLAIAHWGGSKSEGGHLLLKHYIRRIYGRSY